MNVTKLAVSLLAVVSVTALASCAAKDETPPPAPRLDPIRSPTRLDRQVLSGTAEYGSTLTVTRAPAFTDEEGSAFGPFELEVDPFTAAWRIEVPLAPDAENRFSLTATDAAGNTSEAAEATIVQEAPRADGLRLALDSSIVDAADGRLTARVEARSGEAGVPLEGLGIELAVAFSSGGPDGGVAPITVTTDAEGRASATFEGLTTTGAGTLTATASLGGASDAADFLVQGGLPASLSLTLASSVDGTPVGPEKVIDVLPDAEITALVTIRDQPANELNVPFRLYTDAPGARIVGNAIQGITAAGRYHVVATVEGLPGAESGLLVSDQAVVNVEPGPADAIRLTLGRGAAVAGEAVPVSAEARDAYGNPVTGLAPILASSDAGAVFAGGTVTHTAAGAKTITASLDLDGDGTADVQRTADLQILPAAPSAVALTLDAADVDGQAAGLQVLPATDVGLSWAVSDAYGNAVDAGVSITTTAPGFLRGDVLADVTRAGTYDVVARVEGTGLADVQRYDVVPADAARIDLALSDPAPLAGETITAGTTARDAYGNELPGAVIDLATDVPAGGITLDAAAGTLNITAAGDFTVTATLAADATVAASAPVQVSPGPTSLVDLQLSASAIQAGDLVTYTVESLDAYGNATGDLVRLATDAPGAVIAGGQIANLAVAGSYHVWAEATGTGVSDMEPLSISAGTAATLELALAASAVRQGEPLTYTLSLVDGYGNPVAGTPAVTTTDPGATVDAGASVIRFDATGLQQVTATYGGLTDVEQVLVMEVPDIVAPTAEITAPAAGDSLVPGETYTVTVHATDDRTLASVRLQIRGAFSFDETALVTTSPSTTDTAVDFSVRVPGGSAFGPATLTPAATDAAGNLTVGQPIPVEVNPNALITVNGGTVTTLAGGPGSAIRSPRGLGYDGAGTLYLANGNQDVLTLDVSTGALAALGPNLGNTIYDVAYDPTTGLTFASEQGRVGAIDAAGQLTDPWSNGWFRPESLLLIPGRRLVAADGNNGTLVSFDPTAAPQVSPSVQWNVPGQPSGVDATLVSGGLGLIFYTDSGNDALWLFDHTNGNTLRIANNQPWLDRPRELLVLTNGDLLVANEGNGTLVRFACSGGGGCTPSVVASGFERPYGLARAADGSRIWVSDRNWDAIFEITGSF